MKKILAKLTNTLDIILVISSQINYYFHIVKNPNHETLFKIAGIFIFLMTVSFFEAKATTGVQKT
jgi:hypothetical protein